MDFNYTEMSRKVNEWSNANFGAQPSYRPLLGLCEEVGELIEAVDADNVEKILDSVADITIFAMDYTMREGLDTSDIDSVHGSVGSARDKLYQSPNRRDLISDMTKAMGRVCHAHLKTEQGIRVSENHVHNKIISLCVIIRCVIMMAQTCDADYVEVVNKTWAEVSQRVWTKNPVNGVI